MDDEHPEDERPDIDAEIKIADHVCVDQHLGERERGMLAPVDRDYLRGKREYDHRQSAYKRREEIRERVYNALLDFELVMHHMDDKELERIFDPPEEVESDFHAALADMLGMIYYEQSVTAPSFETLLKRGINRAERRYADSRAYQVDVDLTIERRSPEHIDLEEAAEELSGHFVDIDEVSESSLRTFVKYYAMSDEFDPEVPQQKFDELFSEQLEEINNAVEERQRARREKQGRKRESGNDEE